MGLFELISLLMFFEIRLSRALCFEVMGVLIS